MYAVAPYISFPMTAALVGCSSNLAGLIDAKMDPAYRATAVAMFRIGDVEQRFDTCISTYGVLCLGAKEHFWA